MIQALFNGDSGDEKEESKGLNCVLDAACTLIVPFL